MNTNMKENTMNELSIKKWNRSAAAPFSRPSDLEPPVSAW